MRKIVAKLRAVVARIERSELSAQAFRFVRVAGAAVVGSVATGNPFSGAAIAGAVEVAFRKVFPHGVADVVKTAETPATPAAPAAPATPSA